MFPIPHIDFNVQLMLMIVLVMMTYYLIIEYNLIGLLFTSFFYIAGFISIGIMFKLSEYHYNAIMAFQVAIIISSYYLYKYVKKVKNSQEKLFYQSIIDEVTGVYNRRYSSMKLEEVYEYAKRYNQKFSLIILDIDKFKEVNDSQGHLFGDKILSEFSNEMLNTLRSSDIFCRIGGDEFAIITPNHIDENLIALTDRICNVTEEINKRFSHKLNGEFSVSVGFSEYPNDAENLEDIIRFADYAMYEAKTYNNTKLVSFSELKESSKD